MKTYSKEAFLEWARNRGVIPYPDSPDYLRFESGPGLWRFWQVPAQPKSLPNFLGNILSFVEPWESCFVWRHLGRWPEEPNGVNVTAAQFQMLLGLELPLGTEDIVEFAETETHKLDALLLLTMIYAWCTYDDLYVVPDTGRYILKTNHHDVVHVTFRNQRDLSRFCRKMDKEGHHLPTEPPDRSFKIQPWMGSQGTRQ